MLNELADTLGRPEHEGSLYLRDAVVFLNKSGKSKDVEILLNDDPRFSVSGVKPKIVTLMNK